MNHAKKVECHDRADTYVRAYNSLVDPGNSNDLTTNLGDMLTDLMHWADLEGVDWAEALAQGERHFDDETDDEDDEDDEEGEEPDTYLDNVDGHWYVVRYGARPQVHALDCATCADAPEGAWVVVHEVGREFGGPEEGGWWYDTGRVVYRRRVMPDESQADQLAQAERLFDTTTGHRFSMSRRGTDYRASVGPDRGEDYPEVRPHYE